MYFRKLTARLLATYPIELFDSAVRPVRPACCTWRLDVWTGL
jgi:hypothetical protein